AKTKAILEDVPGVENVLIFHIRGQSHVEFRPDPRKLQKFGSTTADVNNVISSALGAQPQSYMIEGEKIFPIAIRWPAWRRSGLDGMLDIPVDINNNRGVQRQGPNVWVPWPTGSGHAPPSYKGGLAMTDNPLSDSPRVPLRWLVTPLGPDGSPDPSGQFL